MPSFCRTCSCPEYENGLDSTCDLCSHLYQWHLAPYRLTTEEAEDIKLRGGVPLEYCKAKLEGIQCPCPNFVKAEIGENCALCGCRSGWHKWKPNGVETVSTKYGPPSTMRENSNTLDSGSTLRNQQQSFSNFSTSPVQVPVSYSQYSQAPPQVQNYHHQQQQYQSNYHYEPQHLPPISIPTSNHNMNPSFYAAGGGGAGSQGSSSLGNQSNSSWGMSPTSPQDLHSPISHQQHPFHPFIHQPLLAPMPPKPLEHQYHWGATPPIANFPQSHYFGTTHTIPKSNQQPIVLEETEEDSGYYNERLTPEENRRRKGKDRQASVNGILSPMSPVKTRDVDAISISEQDAWEDPEFFLPQRAQPPSAHRVRSPRRENGSNSPINIPLSITPGHLLDAEREWRHNREGSQGGSNSSSNESPTTRSPPHSPLIIKTTLIGTPPIRPSFPQAFISNNSPQQTQQHFSVPPPPPPIPQPPSLPQIDRSYHQYYTQPYYQPPLPPSRQQPPPQLPQPPLPRPHAQTFSYSTPPIPSSPPTLSHHPNSAPTISRSSLPSSIPSIEEFSNLSIQSDLSSASVSNGSTSSESQGSRSSIASIPRATSPASGLSAVIPTRPQLEIHESKNMTLSISPPLARRKFSPGQKFEFKLDLGPKVSLASYDKIEVRLVGCSFVYGEPPDSHDFLSVKSSILPASFDVTPVGNANRSFSWSMTLPLDQTCDCRDLPHPLPASYGHSSFKVDYKVELIAKKVGRFSIGGPEKLEVPFIVDSPFIEDSQLVIPPTRSIDGEWSTMRLAQITIMENTSAKIVSSEIAWQILPSSSDLTITKIPYRFTLNFGQLPPSEYLDLTVLDKIAETLRVSVSRRVVLMKAGKKGGGKENPLPALRVTLKEFKQGGERIVVDGITLWRFEGNFEIKNSDLRAVLVCNVNVRYSISAHVPIRGGISPPIDIIARNLNLELPQVSSASPNTSTTTIASNSQVEVERGRDLEHTRSETSTSNHSIGSVGSSRREFRLELPPDFNEFEPTEEDAPPPFHDAVEN